jgi:hypothetical protein
MSHIKPLVRRRNHGARSLVQPVVVDAAFGLAHDLGPLWLAAMWLGSVRWVRVDARQRLANPSAIRAATWLALALPFAGVAVWTAVRPHETRRNRRERRVVTLLLESQIPAREPERPVEEEPAAAVRARAEAAAA